MAAAALNEHDSDVAEVEVDERTVCSRLSAPPLTVQLRCLVTFSTFFQDPASRARAMLGCLAGSAIGLYH